MLWIRFVREVAGEVDRVLTQVPLTTAMNGYTYHFPLGAEIKVDDCLMTAFHFRPTLTKRFSLEAWQETRKWDDKLSRESPDDPEVSCGWIYTHPQGETSWIAFDRTTGEFWTVVGNQDCRYATLEEAEVWMFNALYGKARSS